MHPQRSLSGVRSVHSDDLAGDERCLMGCEEHDCLRHLLGTAHSTDRMLSDELFAEIIAAKLCDEAVGHFGFDDCRSDSVDSDSLSRELQRGGLRQTGNRMLAGGIQSHRSESDQTSDAGVVDDDAVRS